MFQYIRKTNKQSASLLLLLLLCADFAFIVIHTDNAFITFYVTKMESLIPPPLSIGTDRGYAEIYQYIKFFWIIIVFAYVNKSTKSLSYVSWILVFTFFLCDDAFSLHENAGLYFAKIFYFNLPFNVKLDDFGEIVFWAIIGIFLLIILARAYLHGSHTFKKVSIDISLFVIAFVFFGVVVDLLHSSIELWKVLSFGLGTVEDGGELVVASLILWYVFLLALQNGYPNLFLHDFIPNPLTLIWSGQKNNLSG
jgi:hypothetical protein